jgi:hypothetical protein
MAEGPAELYEMTKKITVFQVVTTSTTSRMEVADASEEATLRIPQKTFLFVLCLLWALGSKYIYKNFSSGCVSRLNINRDSSVSIVFKRWARRKRNRGSIPVRGKVFFSSPLLQNLL